jgi:polysaccharide chain length determinant protein (PEP-CTERM system associated)
MQQTTSIDIRQYLFVLKRRWALSVLVFFLVLGTGIGYCLFWPKTYQATALIVVQPQKVPGSIVQTTITSKIEDRLQIITQRVLSRSRLTELIDRFKLYPREKGKMTPDELAERMRKDITIKITRKNYFTITYLYKDAQAVSAVTNALASFYVDSNLRLREQDAVGTARFLTRELERMRNQLKEWDARITKFKQEHLQELPSAQEKNLQVMEHTRRAREHVEEMIGEDLNRIAFLERSLVVVNSEIQKIELRKAHERKVGSTTAGGGGQQGQGESSPEAIKKEIERLRVFYTDNHPDIQRLKRHLLKAEAQKAERESRLRAQGKTESEIKDSAALEVASLVETRDRMGRALAEHKARVKEYREQRDQLTKDIQLTQQRIQNGPIVAKDLEELTRGYDVLKDAFESMHAKWLDANMAANLERTQRGEQFEVVDPAQKPDEPYRPSIKRAIPVSFVMALALAVGIAFGLNFLDNSFTSVEQMERLTELPVLVVVPPLTTPAERSKKKRNNMLLLLLYILVGFFMAGLLAILFTGRGAALKQMLLGIFS